MKSKTSVTKTTAKAGSVLIMHSPHIDALREDLQRLEAVSFKIHAFATMSSALLERPDAGAIELRDSETLGYCFMGYDLYKELSAIRKNMVETLRDFTTVKGGAK